MTTNITADAREVSRRAERRSDVLESAAYLIPDTLRADANNVIAAAEPAIAWLEEAATSADADLRLTALRQQHTSTLKAHPPGSHGRITADGSRATLAEWLTGAQILYARITQERTR